MNSVEFLNKLCDETLKFTHYTNWELASYGEGSPFCQGGPIGHVRGKTIDECVNKAIKTLKEKINDTL